MHFLEGGWDYLRLVSLGMGLPSVNLIRDGITFGEPFGGVCH